MRTLDALKKLFVAQGGDEAVVRDLHTDGEVIDKIADNGGGGSGYTVEETKQTVIAEQTVQTVSQGDWYSGSPSGDLSGVSDGTKCFVTYNGTEYEVDATEDTEHGVLILGELGGQSPVFTNYPFVIAASAGQSFLMAQTAKPTIKVEVLSKTVTPSDDFKAAVEASGSGGILRVSFGWDEQADTDTADKTFAEIWSAINAGKAVVGIDDYEGEVTNLELVSYSDSNLVFCGINMRKAMLYSGATLMFVQYEISADNQVTSDSQEYTLTPSNGG